MGGQSFGTPCTGPWQILNTEVISIGDFNGAMEIFHQVDTGSYTIWNGEINGVTLNFSTGHRSFPGPVLSPAK